ncbi:M10 family metallopeptidase C-terminal domain-containing protein [Roseomonas sp. CCTCC AB2023176]|uniref:M10 family metallopeptidase C-terminal domain-containing protein n=1 Tax=Roseomonas sp. CCTCC AB2023176 TaxID=3342640 RepID=UPI0035D93EE4
MASQAYASPGLTGPADIVGFAMQNAGAGLLAAGITTMGQVFGAGDLPAGTSLVAHVDGALVPVQVDVKTTYADGSVKMAVLTVARPELAAGASADVVLSRAAGGATAPALDLASALGGHSAAVNLTFADGRTVSVDVLGALKAALADGSASFWQQGPLATQARVDVPVGGSMRLVFDVTAFNDGHLSIDALFNNDGAMGTSGGRVSYTATATLDGRTVLSETVNQAQYQNWHREFGTGADGTQGLGAQDAGWLNIRHDVSYIERSGAILDYDQGIALKPELLSSWATALNAPGWGEPLSSNGVAKYMPGTGAREDIGATTAANSAWLITGNAVAAARAMGQAEAAGSVPWNMWDAKNDTWLSSDDYPKLWTDGRGGTGKAGVSRSTGLTQQVPTDTGWTPDSAHQPNLSFVPYILTGERWIADNLTAQAAWNVMNAWPAMRTSNNDVVVNQVQVRAAAWSLREIDQAAWAAPDGSAEKSLLQSASEANWKWLVAQLPAWTAMQGEAHGWLPISINGTQSVAPWQQDYFASTAIAAAERGNADALTVVTWMENFLVGRFQAADKGFAMHDGAAYHIVTGNAATGEVYKTWAEIGAATVKAGWSNGTGWAQSQGDYGKLALQTLASLYNLTGSAAAKQAYEAVLADHPPFTSMLGYGGEPQQAITIADSYAKLAWGTAVANPAPSSGHAPGTPTTAAATFASVSDITATGSDDSVALSKPVSGGTVNLLGGNDRLVLSSAGPNTLTVLNTETIMGGGSGDTITLSAALTGGSVNLGAAMDKLVLSSNGPNDVTTFSVELVVGGSAADRVAATGPAARLEGWGGDDTLTGGPNDDTLHGGAGADLLDGGAGSDLALLEGKQADYVFSGSTANFRATAGGVTDTLLNIERVKFLGSGITLAVTGLTITAAPSAAPAQTTIPDALTAPIPAAATAPSAGPTPATTGATATVTGTSATGTAGDDAVTLSKPVRMYTVDLLGGTDSLALSATGANKVTVSNVEAITGGAGTDTVTVAAPLTGGVVDLAGGSDRLVLSSSGPNTVTVQNVERIVGGSADDAVTLSMPTVRAVVDLGGGHDTLVLSSGGMNLVRAWNVETVIGGAAQDTVILGTPLSGGTVDLGDGRDTLYLSATGANKLTLLNTESVVGSSGADEVTLGTAVTHGHFDLRGGADRLVLSSDGDNSIAVVNTETVIGGAADDRIVVTGNAATRVEGGAGRDVLIGGAGANTLLGGAGADVMSGGARGDRFVFTAVSDSTAEAPDRITDFDGRADLLVFQGLIHGDFAFRGAAEFTGQGSSEARYVEAAHQLLVDTDGNGTADMRVVLDGISLAQLSAADFVWN